MPIESACYLYIALPTYVGNVCGALSLICFRRGLMHFRALAYLRPSSPHQLFKCILRAHPKCADPDPMCNCASARLRRHALDRTQEE